VTVRATGELVLPPDDLRVCRLGELGEREVEDLARVLVDCVAAGASVSFMLPLPEAKARAFWRSLAAGVASGARVVLAAEDGSGTILGTVQLLLEQPENQPHRADLAKMLVTPRARRRGIGAMLLAAAEREAAACGKTLLVLDTASEEAARLYSRQGWQRCGQIPGYAFYPDGRPCATTFFFKPLG